MLWAPVYYNLSTVVPFLYHIYMKQEILMQLDVLYQPKEKLDAQSIFVIVWREVQIDN